MGCCSFRRGRLGLDGKSLRAEQGSWAFARLSGEVNLVLRGLAGQELRLTFPSTAPLQELREAVHDRWKIPLLAQQFVRDSAIISGEPETAIGLLLELPEGGDIDLTCIRRQLPLAEQYAVDCRLLQAVAAAADRRHDGIRTALAQGARPGGLGVPEASPAVRSAPSPLQIARALGDTSAAELLLAAGAEEDAEEMVKRDEKEFPSIRRAFAARNLRAVVRCLARGEDVNTWLRRGDGVQDTSGGTPLHACCAQHQLPGATAVLALLCHLRADVNAGDSEGDSPLAHARYFGAKEMEELLRAQGAQLRGPYYQYRLMRR